MMDNLSVADALALQDSGNRGFGTDGGFIWVLVLLIFMFNNGGAGGFGGQGATAATQHEILLGQQFESIGNKLNSIGDGLCQGFYALNNSVMGEGRALQGQLSDCCCKTQLGIANLGANIDRQTCAVTTAVHAEGEATRAMIRENEIQALRDKVADLQLRASQCDQNTYLVNQLKAPCPVPAYQVPNPNCCYNYGCGCGGQVPNI